MSSLLKHGSVSAFGIPDNMTRQAATKLNENIVSLAASLKSMIDAQAELITQLRSDLEAANEVIATKALSSDLTSLTATVTDGLATKENKMAGRGFIGDIGAGNTNGNGALVLIPTYVMTQGNVGPRVKYQMYRVKNGVLVSVGTASDWKNTRLTSGVVTAADAICDNDAAFAAIPAVPGNVNWNG